MNVIFMDGFDLYNGLGANTGFQSRWQAIDWRVGPSIVTGRFGGQAFRIYGDRFGDNHIDYVPFGSAQSEFTVGVAIRVSNVAVLVGTPGAMARGLLCLTSGGYANTQIGFRPNNDGSISVYRMTSSTAGVLLGTTPPGMIQTNVWHYIEFSGLIDPAAGTVIVKVDGVEGLNLSAQNTQGYATNATFDGMITFISNIINSDNVPIDIDDLYVTDSQVSLGERRIETLRGMADTVDKDFIPDVGTENFSRVNENTVNTANYVQSATVDALDLYEIADLTGTPPNVDAVQIIAFAQKNDAGARSLGLVADLAGVQLQSPDKALAASYAPIVYTMGAKPGGGGWTFGDVNLLKVGPKVTA